MMFNFVHICSKVPDGIKDILGRQMGQVNAHKECSVFQNILEVAIAFTPESTEN